MAMTPQDWSAAWLKQWIRAVQRVSSTWLGGRRPGGRDHKVWRSESHLRERLCSAEMKCGRAVVRRSFRFQRRILLAFFFGLICGVAFRWF